MVKNFKFAVDKIQKIQIKDYEDDEFAIARMGFLSTRPNSHQLKISEKVLKTSAPSVLNKWVVADMTGIVDAGTHTKNEHIVGRIPENQEVEFEYDDDGYLRAYVDTVISKIYAKDFCKIFENDNKRNVSVEMKVVTPEDDEQQVDSFKIVGVTVLGHSTKPSCPESDIQFVRFSDEDADNFFNKVHQDSLTELQNFAKERKLKMATTYKIDKSKEAMSDKPWGEVDKTSMRNKIMEASNRKTLVKAVYALVENGWEDAPSEHLKYPIMELKGDTFVYNRDGLASALGYAKKENETAVVNKIEKIYKSLDLDGKEEDAKMSKEIEFAAVDIGAMWSKLWDAIEAKDIHMCIDGIYEEDNQKFAILCARNGDKYRLDFSFTEDGLTIADNMTKVEVEFVPTDKVLTFAEPENVEEYRKFSDDDDDDDDKKDEDEDKDDDDEDVEMSADEMKAEMSRLQSEIENRDNIIMDKDAKMAEIEKELEELRQFKAGIEKEKLAMSVESVLAEVKDFVKCEEDYKKFREEGLACNMSELDAWTNRVKAYCFEHNHKSTKKTQEDFWSFAAPITTQKKTNSVWDEL